MKVLITAQEVMDMVIKAMAENGHRFDNIKHEVTFGVKPEDSPIYNGISFEMNADTLIKGKYE